MSMEIAGAVALVTGANRGIGAAYVEALLAAGAAKVYATVRDPATLGALRDDSRVTPAALDIRRPEQVAATAAARTDVNLLINCAGINFNTPALAAPSMDNARQEIETNYLGTLAMCRAFAPVLKANGGGAIVNMLTILSKVNFPLMGSYCATKAAGLSLTQAVRAELAGQGTLVVAVMPGAVDTRMTEGLDVPKMQPAEVAEAALQAIREGAEDIYPGDMAVEVAAGLAADSKAVEKEFAGYL